MYYIGAVIGESSRFGERKQYVANSAKNAF